MSAKYYIAAAEPIKTFRDGREVCDLTTAQGKREYERRREVMWERQLGRCAICLKKMPLEDAQFDHEGGRGHGGGKRDDRIWNEDGGPKNASLDSMCNSRKGSKRYAWQDGIYQPIGRADGEGKSLGSNRPGSHQPGQA